MLVFEPVSAGSRRGAALLGAALSLTLLGPAPALAASGSWKQVAAGPLAPRYGAEVVAVGGQFLVFGGHPGTRCADGEECPPALFDFARDAALFDPAAGTWRAAADVPGPFRATTTAVVGGIVYALGETPCLYEDVPFVQDACPDPDTTKTLLAYDPKADTWTALPAPPGGNYQLDGGTLLDAGGRLVSLLARRGSHVEAGAVFDGASWTALPRDPLIAAIPKEDVQGLGAVWTGGRLLLAAGADGDRGAVRLASLDLASGRWTAVAGVRFSAYNLPVLVAGRVVWPGGGTYDPSAKAFRALPAGVRAAAVTAPEVDATHPVPDGLVVGRRVTLNGRLFDPLTSRSSALPALPAATNADREPGFAAGLGAIFRFGGARVHAPSGESYLLVVRGN